MLKILNYYLYLALAVAAISAAGPVYAQLKMPVINPADVEALVRTEFVDNPDMIAIAKCESGFRQFTSDGMPLRGGGGQYIGVFQISEGQADAAGNLGFDIYSLEGNIGYAKYLFQQRGIAPWAGCVNASSLPAAGPAPIPAGTPITAASGSLTQNLGIGMAGEQVRLLQQLLNAKGFTVAATGPGSPGSETTLFGPLTRAAVNRFQCAQRIVCGGTESTTGYGYAGPRTRAALSK